LTLNENVIIPLLIFKYTNELQHSNINRFKSDDFVFRKDILGYALKVMSDDELNQCKSDGTSEFLAILKRHKTFSEATCGQVANASQRDILIQGTNPNLFFFLFCHSVLYSQSI
jgi:hypothetical protein